MPQTWDEKGNLISPSAKPSVPPPTAPTIGQKKTWDEKGNLIQAKPAVQPPAPNQAQTNPFRSGVMEATGFDPNKIISKGGFVPQTKEMGAELAGNVKELGKSIIKDPIKGIASPIRQMALALEFHTGRPILDSELKKQGIDETAIDEIVRGFHKSDNQALSHGAGRLVGALGNVLGAVEAPKVLEDVRGVGNVARDLTKRRAIVSAASHAALDTLKDDHTNTINTAVKAERQRIGGSVASLNTKDIAKDPNGYVPQKLALAVLDQAVSDKKAQVLMNKRMLPKVAQVRGLLEGHTGNMTFNDIKQVRTVVGDSLNKATGVERAVLSDYYNSLSNNLRARAGHLGGLSEWEDYNTSNERLSGHEKGLIPELTESKTGLEYVKKIVSEQNQGRLSTLSKDLKLPDNFFSNAVKTHRPIINFAKMSEGDSLVAKTANRLIALKQHPISAALGGTVGVTLGRAMGSAVGSPMAGSFIGLTLGAAFAHDLMSKMDAAKAIREIGGPSGVTGVRRPPQAPSPSGATPSTGPGGGGSPSSTAPPVMPSGSPSKGLSPAIAKLLPSSIKISTDPTGIKWAEGPGGVKVSIPKSVAEPEITKYVEGKIAEQSKMQSEIKVKAAPQTEPSTGDIVTINQSPGYKGFDPSKPTQKMKVVRVQGGDFYLRPVGTPEEIEGQRGAVVLKHELGPTEPKVTKAEPEARGRTTSARKGMTKDTPEARRAKAAERIASRRAESSRTNIKASLEDQARQVAGRMDFQGKSNIELEEGLAELFGENGNRFLKQFKSLARQQKWSDEIYRGYLEDTIDRRAKELAQRPNIPGLGTEPKVE